MNPPQKKTPTTTSGVKLTRYLEQVWQRLGTTRGAWCREHRIADSTVLRWSLGVEPDMRNYRAVAEALDVDLIQVLEIAGEIAPKTSRKPAKPMPHVCRLETALEEDTSVPAGTRQLLRGMLDAARSNGRTRANPGPARRRTAAAEDGDDPARADNGQGR